MANADQNHKCREVQQKIPDVVLGQASHGEQRQILAHVGRCEMCKQHLILIQRLHNALHSSSNVNFLGGIGDGRTEYWVEKQILGSGGMGVVLVARAHDEPNVQFAVKIMHPESWRKSKSVDRFLLEAKALQKVDHPGVVKIISVGDHRKVDHRKVEHKFKFIVMNKVPGNPLSDIINASGGSLPIEDIVTYGGQIANALGACHGKGGFHRDLKPDNVVVAKYHGREPEATLIDFGLARFPGAPEPMLKFAFEGTPGYAAPEQVYGADGDVRSDVFSLGATLFHMVEGHHPYFRTWHPTAATKDIYDAIKDMHFRPSFKKCKNEQLKQIIAKSLSYHAHDRYESAADVKNALEELVIDDPPPPVPPWIKLFAILLLLIAFLFIIGVVPEIWLSEAPPPAADLEEAKQVKVVMPEPGAQVGQSQEIVLKDVYVPAGYELWLTDTRDDGIRPRGYEIEPGRYGEIRLTAYFEGDPGPLELELYLVPPKGQWKIGRWLFWGRITGRFAGWENGEISGATKINAVEDLKQP